MSTSVFVLLCLLVALIAASMRGRTWTFAYLYIPSLLLVPFDLVLEISGTPDLTAQRAILVGMLAGCFLSGRLRTLFPRWRRIDWLPVLMILSFATSFGIKTDMHGFFFRLVVLSVDWGLPYAYSRAVFADLAGFRAVVPSMAVCASIQALLSLAEARLNVRVQGLIWNAIASHDVPPFWTEFTGAFRWGYLRAQGSFSHPLLLASVLVASAPLALCWNLLRRKGRMLALAACLLVALGAFAPISRGPLLVLGASAVFFGLASQRVPVLSMAVVALLAGAPLLISEAEGVIRSTEADLATAGNTDSAHYRAALLLIYADEFDKLGVFGNDKIVGTTYESAWSIDNGFLQMYITGGWMGGTLFLALVLLTLVQGYRALLRSRGLERKLRAAILAAFAGLAGCLANVWFAPELASLFFVVVALVWDQLQPNWYRIPASRPLRRQPLTNQPVVAAPGSARPSSP